MNPDAPKRKRRNPKRGTTRIAWNTAAKNRRASLTVPTEIARLVGTERLFHVELTAEGILYRYVEGGEPLEFPDWLVGR